MNGQLLIDLRTRRLPQSIGGKAANLRLLIDGGFRVPAAFVIPWEAHERYRSNDGTLVRELHNEIERLLHLDKKYAVRSSANIEDALERSFAGQFKTCLDVQGAAEIIRSIYSVWESAASPDIQQYLDRLPGGQEALRMAVIVQEMVAPVFSGVAFSRNPMTGASETVVEAVEGSGLRLLQEGFTPYRWIHKWGRWVAQPEETPVQLSLIQQVVDGVSAISRTLKYPVDLEWVYDGKLLYWVQVRQITMLKDLQIYSNRISREVLPGQIKPLIWSINIPLVISQWIRLLTEMIGENDLQPNDLAKQFHYFAYFNMGALGRVFNLAGFPSEGLEMMMGIVPKEAGRPAFRLKPSSLRLLPRLLWFMIKKWTLESDYNKNFPALEKQVQSISTDRLNSMTDSEVIAAIDHHFQLVVRIAWYNINVPILMNMYNALLTKQLSKQDIQPEQLDLMADVPDADRYDPNPHLGALNAHWKTLQVELRDRVARSSYEEFLLIPGIESFQADVARFIHDFGHFSDSGNDFSYMPWREQPDLILRMICEFQPHARSDSLLKFEQIKKCSPLLNLFYGRTRRFRHHRDRISHHYTYSYGLFRKYFRVLAQRLVDRGLLDEWQDIFYLTWEEVRSLVIQGDDLETPARLKAASRKVEMENSRKAELPSVIYGDQAPPVIRSAGERMTGTPTSPGYYSGCVRMIRGIQHFEQLQQGDVLVIPYSDVGWTPLFARAGAVIAESGGILSHSAIVAREYRIPAVLSVTGAMQRLQDGQIVTVDGYKGEIIVHKD